MAKNKPLILVTNDDGITAKGIHSLVKVAIEFGDVVVVAPNKPQSGMGHAVTIDKILRLEKHQFGVDGVDLAFATNGTPVDCVKLAIYSVLKGRKPDLLVSGINHGSNSSINVIYSGTMSAAVEGAVEGIPSIGFSLLNHDTDADFSGSQQVIKGIIEKALTNQFPDDVCLNVNIPNVPFEEIKGVKVCRQAKAFWSDAFDSRKDPAGKEYFWLKGEFKIEDQGNDTDEWSLKNKYVSVVPTHYDLTAHHALGALNTWKL